MSLNEIIAHGLAALLLAGLVALVGLEVRDALRSGEFLFRVGTISRRANPVQFRLALWWRFGVLALGGALLVFILARLAGWNGA